MKKGEYMVGDVSSARPWRYDRVVVHNGVTNWYSFLHKGKKVVLLPLSPSEVWGSNKNEIEKRKRKKNKEGKSPLKEKSQRRKKKAKKETRNNKRKERKTC